MKIAVIGGGSSYTPELINGFLARRDTLPVSELWLMDILPERLEIVGGFAQRMVEAAGSPFAVHLTTDQREAVRGANYVLTQLRVGWMAARREDEYLGKRHGLLGQETTGVGGMAKALRTIPVILSVAHDMRELAPGAVLVNFTNPAGLVTEALQRYAPEVTSMGLCNVPITTSMNILKRLGIDEAEAPRAHLDTLGLNHLTWHRGFTLDDEDLWPQVMKDYLERLRVADKPEWDARTIETLHMIPNGYVGYFYYTDEKIAQQEQWPPSRAERVMKIEEDLLAQYAEPDRVTPPEGLMQRGGAYYSTLATQVLQAHYNDAGEIHVVNTRHNGVVPGWPADWVLELPSRIDAAGVHPLPAEPLPPACFGLVAAVKSYEQLTVEAAVHGDRDAAYQALLVHPLGPSADQVQSVLDDMLETNRRYLPQFFTDEAKGTV